MILKRMKRRHSRADAVAFCKKVNKLRPDIVFGADLIAGFPTETEEMFRNSLALVEECDLTYLHVFPFSPRPGTPAARMPQHDRSEIKERAQRLRQLGEATLNAYLTSCRGQRVEVLAEKDNIGRTPHFAELTLDAKVSVGQLVSTTVTGYESGRLTGSILT